MYVSVEELLSKLKMHKVVHGQLMTCVDAYLLPDLEIKSTK
jgi:hypothetical protein